jgi:tRNA (cmo5U34)-methyltransferase
MKTMDKVKKHIEGEAKDFDRIIKELIPYYAEMIDGMVAAIPHQRTDLINVIDLGCGTGTISRQIKQTFPQARITCLGIAENMIEMSKLKLNNYSDVQYRIGDFKDYEFDDTYDIVVSSLALHHLVTDDDKISFYRKIYESLCPGGVFFNADVVLGSNEHFQSLYMGKWISFMKRHVFDEEIETKWLPKYREEDRPSKLMDQLIWLKDIGFSEIDIIWKYYNYAVYGGRMPIIT